MGRRFRSPLVLALVAGAVCASAGCRATQRVPAPMPLDGEEGGVARPGSDGVRASASVIRHSDPVSVRRPGAIASYPLAFYEKRERVAPGGAVLVGTMGRAELLWPASATSVVALGAGEAIVGEPRSDEPLVRFERCSKVQLTLSPDDRIGFPGGLELVGREGPSAGPFLVEQRESGALRVKNQSKTVLVLAFRGEELELLAGDAVEIPVLGDRVPGAPPSGRLRWNSASRPGGRTTSVEATGGIELVEEEAGDLRIRATEACTVLLGGIRIEVSAGEELFFSPADRESLRGMSQSEGPSGE